MGYRPLVRNARGRRRKASRGSVSPSRGGRRSMCHPTRPPPQLGFSLTLQPPPVHVVILRGACGVDRLGSTRRPTDRESGSATSGERASVACASRVDRMRTPWTDDDFVASRAAASRTRHDRPGHLCYAPPSFHWTRGVAAQHASLSRWRSPVRIRSGPPRPHPSDAPFARPNGASLSSSVGARPVPSAGGRIVVRPRMTWLR